MNPIKFKLTKKDYWEYNKYSILHIKGIRNIFIMTPILVFCSSIFAGLIFNLDMFVCSAIAILLPAFYIATIYFPMKKGVFNINNDKLVEQTIEVDESKKLLIQTIGSKRHKYNKSNIYKYRRYKNYIFITTSGFSGIMIPGSDEYSLDELMPLLDKIFA